MVTMRARADLPLVATVVMVATLCQPSRVLGRPGINVDVIREKIGDVNER